MSQNREGFNPNSPATNTGTGAGSGSSGIGSGSYGSGNIGSGGTGSGTPGSGSTGTATALSQTAQDYGQKISEAATQAKDYVSDKVSVVGDKLKELQNADLGEVTENAKEYARKNPGQAILISAAAGLVLGLILRGRRQ
ncbi:MAG: YqjD family protein [Pyrinomonadaceae bacterium]